MPSVFGTDGPYSARAAKMLATVLHLHRGTPYVYQGEELGMTNAPLTSIEQFRDIESLNHYATAVAPARSPAAVITAMRPNPAPVAMEPWEGTVYRRA